MLGYLAMAGDADRAVIIIWEGVGWEEWRKVK
jgi:hypothetical protein